MPSSPRDPSEPGLSAPAPSAGGAPRPVHEQAAAALRESERRYRELVDTSFDWVWETDPAGRYTYCSARVRQVLGYEPAEVLGRTVFELMPPAEAARTREILAGHARARRPFELLEKIHQHRDGTLVILESNGVPRHAPDGTWLGYRGIDRDITRRRAAESMMRLQGAALAAAANAVVITDRRGLIEWTNPAFTTLSGWTLAEVSGRKPGDVLKSGEHDDAFYRQMWATLQQGRVWRGEIVNRRRDGRLRTEDMTITPVVGDAGAITHFIAIKQDITEHKAMEQQFLQAQRVEAIGTLAGGIAHDLNNILAPILLIAGTLQSHLASESDRELLAMMQGSARRGAEIIKQLLTFSRGHAGQPSLVQPRHLVKEMMQMMRETFPRQIELHHQVVPELWPVRADPTQLQQLLLNLCVNARDAMPAGGCLTLAAGNLVLADGDPRLPPHARAGAHVVLEVTDTGGGIPPEIRHRIFDPFFTTKAPGKGTGLGLATALGIAQHHGGWITVDSTVGSGSTFRAFLPAAPGSSEPDIAPTPAPVCAASAREPARTILLVEDERDVRDATQLLLEAHGYRVHTAANGQDGLTHFLQQRQEISLVITDVMMPVMDGITFLRALRAIDPRLPVMVTSGLSECPERPELDALGVADLILKPCEAATLLHAVRERLAVAAG